MPASMNDETVFAFLRRVALFAEVPEADLRRLAQAARPSSVKRGGRIFEEDSPATSCYVLTAGRAKVVLSGAFDSEIMLGTVEPFELVGELALLDGSNRSAGLVAMDDSRLIRVPKAAFLALRNGRAFEDRLMVHVTSMLRRATEQLRAIYTYSSKDRVCWSLARLASRMGTRMNGVVVISPVPSQQELADMTGVARETVARALAELEHAGWIDRGVRRVALRERAFRRYLEGQPGTAGGVDVTRL